jgi:OTU domain-containing protein 6
MIEDEKLKKKVEALGLTIQQIKPDGHCLAVENQLSLHSIGTTRYSYHELRQMTAKY